MTRVISLKQRATRAAQARHKVEAFGIVAEQFGGNALAVGYLLQISRYARLVAGRIRGVQPDQLRQVVRRQIGRRLRNHHPQRLDLIDARVRAVQPARREIKAHLALNVLGAALVGIPVLGYILAPARRLGGGTTWIKLGVMAKFPEGETRLATLFGCSVSPVKQCSRRSP